MSILCDLCWKSNCLPQPARGMLTERLWPLVDAMELGGADRRDAACEIARLSRCVDLHARMN